MSAINLPITICGLDATASVEYRITDPGRKGGRDFPTEPMEFDANVERVHIHSDWEDAPEWLERAILQNYDTKIYAAIQDTGGN